MSLIYDKKKPVPSASVTSQSTPNMYVSMFSSPKLLSW